jgi:hypothetical protein
MVDMITYERSTLVGPIRSALAVARMQTPHRFRSKRQLWTYSGLGLETRDSGEYHSVRGQVRRRQKPATIRGLNKDSNHDLKGLFKGAATRASVQPGPFQEFYQRSLAKGIKPTMVRLTLDCSHYADTVEEGSRLRHRQTELASRLSVSGKSPFHLR